MLGIYVSVYVFMSLLVHSLIYEVIISVFLSFSVYLFVSVGLEMALCASKEPWCLLQSFLLMHLLRWGLTDYLPVLHFQCHHPLLCPEFVGKQGSGHRVQVEDRKKLAFSSYW
jgi:hypothetical protein